ncbi:MAG: T9SS type A sorting domain-containing protein [Bacteroidia bacterium]
MKKILLSLLSVAVISLNAQPTLTSANEATIGTSFTYNYVDPTGVQPGNSGASQTWNFASVTPNGTTSVHNYISVASTPYAANFPGTNLVQQVIDTATVYLYHTTSVSSTELNGIAFDAGGTPSIMNYLNSELLRQYPITYNSTLSDTYAGTLTITLGPVTITIYRSGTYYYLADGYGTLITPAGTFTNTLRGKIRQVFTDSMVYVGVPLPAQLSQNFSTSYFWSCTNAPNKLYQFYIGYDTLVNAQGTTPQKSVSYEGSATAIGENAPYESFATVYPNPTSDYAFINLDNSINGTAELFLYDSKGSVVKNISTKMTAASRYEWMFPVSDLANGLYHARITCGDKQWTTQIVKH